MTSPRNTTALESSRVKLNCQAEGDPNNITYRWFKADTEVYLVPGLASRSVVNAADGSLVIRSVVREDSGWYMCQPTNGFSPAPEAKLFLNVTYVPRVLPLPIRLYLANGLTGIVECPVDANPPVTRVTWAINERLIDIRRLSHMRIGADGSLVIARVERKDEGRYSCTAYSSLGSGQMSTPVQVLVRDPPFFSLRPRLFYQRHLGQSVTMPCVAHGDPHPIISWKKVNGTFPQTTSKIRFDGGNLTISQLDETDHGHYECIAKNVVASIIATTIVIIELSHRHPPYILSTETDETSARINWLPGYDNGHPQSYILWYRRFMDETWLTLSVLSDEATTVTVSDLLPGTEYQFMILARCQSGEEQFSAETTATTKGTHASSSSPKDSRYVLLQTPVPQVPLGTSYSSEIAQSLRPSEPINVTVRRLSADVIRLSWNPPRSSPVPIVSYAVEYLADDRKWLSLTPSAPLPSHSTTFDWKTASHGPTTTYHFRVISQSRWTSSQPSTSASIRFGSSVAEKKQWSVFTSTVGVIIAALVFITMSVITSVVVIRFARKNNARQSNLPRYDKVKYFDPNQVGNEKSHHHYDEGGREEGQSRISRTQAATGAAVAGTSVEDINPILGQSAAVANNSIIITETPI